MKREFQTVMMGRAYRHIYGIFIEANVVLEVVNIMLLRYLPQTPTEKKRQPLFSVRKMNHACRENRPRERR